MADVSDEAAPDPKPSRSDLRLMQRAAEGGWIDESKVGRVVSEILTDPDESARNRLSAARVAAGLIKAEKAIKGAGPPEPEVDLTALTDEDLDDLARIADRLAGARSEGGQAGG